MPIPFLLGAIGAVSAVVGIGGHLSAKGTNERAQQIADEAQQIYREKGTLKKPSDLLRTH
jgi:hypothetical protein